MMKRYIIAAAMVATILLSTLASAIIATRTFDSIVIARGTGSVTLANVTTAGDNRFLNVTETSSGLSVTTLGYAQRTNGTSFGWVGSGCANLWVCLKDEAYVGGPPFSDFNGTFIATNGVSPNNASIGFGDASGQRFSDDFASIPPYWRVAGVMLLVAYRKNTSVATTLTVSFIIPTLRQRCWIDTYTMSLAWRTSVPGVMRSDCNGTPWTWYMLNHSEASVIITSANAGVVSTLWLNILLTTDVYDVDVRANATLATYDSPYSANYTCNRTAIDTYQLQAFRPTTASWVTLVASVCPTGAQTSGSVLFPAGTWTDAQRNVSMRIIGSGGNTASAGIIRIDRFVLNVDRNIPPSNITGESYSWLLIFFLFAGGAILVAFKIKKWREGYE